MLSLVSKYLNYIQIAVVAMLLVYIFILRSQVESLELDVNNIKLEKALVTANLGVYQGALKRVNQIIEYNRVDYEANTAKLKKWHEENPTIKYKTIIKIREVKSNDCKDVKSVIDSVSVIDFSSL